MGADLEAEGGDDVEEGGRSVGEMDADGGEFAAGLVVLAEAVEAAAEFGALHAADARYAPHEEARAKELEKLYASECPRCAMRLGCRFRMGEAL